MTSRNVPRLRFKGFKNDFRKIKFDDFVDRITLHSNEDKFLRVEFADINSEEGTINGKLKKGSKNGILFHKNDVLFGKLRPYLKKWLYCDFDGIALGDFWVLRYCNNISDSRFVYSLIQSDHFMNVANYTSGTKMPRSDWKLVANEKFFIPSLPEQQHIGNFFSKLDHLIDLHSQKLEQLKKLKRGYLQKMFPQKGEIVPRLRFHGFSDKWMSHKFGDYLSIPKKEVIEVNDINQLMTLKLNLKGVYRGSTSSTLKLGSTKYYKRHKGQLIYGKQNFFHGSIAIIPDELDGLATSSDVPSLNIDGMDRGYLYYYISRKDFYESAEKYTTGTGSKRLHENDFLELSFMVPSLEEQRKISGFFNSIDNFIEIEKNKLDELKKQKKAYLQKMFI